MNEYFWLSIYRYACVSFILSTLHSPKEEKVKLKEVKPVIYKIIYSQWMNKWLNNRYEAMDKIVIATTAWHFGVLAEYGQSPSLRDVWSWFFCFGSDYRFLLVVKWRPRLVSYSKDTFESGRVHRIEPEDSPSVVISVPLTVGSAGPQGKPVLEYVIFAGSVGELYLNCEKLVSKEACRGGINSSFCSQQLDAIQAIWVVDLQDEGMRETNVGERFLGR